MNYKKLQFFKRLSILILVITVVMTIWAYFRMDELFNTVELKAASSQFQLFVIVIIIGAATSFFISWRLILLSDVANAEELIQKESVDINTEKEVEEIKEYVIDWDGLCENSNVLKYPDTNLEPMLQDLCRSLDIDLGMVFKLNEDDEFENAFNYAYFSDDKPSNFKLGEGLHGQVAQNMKPTQLLEIPDNYIKITSASGFVLPKNIYMIPIVNNGKTVLYFEFADMKTTKSNTFDLLNEFVEKVTNKIF